MLKIFFYISSVLALTFGYISNANAQSLGGAKSLLQQLEDDEASEKRKNIYQGQSQSASKTLKKAQDNATADTKSCPQSSKTRKIEHVKNYINQQDELQRKIASSIERFTAKAIEKNIAIDEFNTIIKENNDVVIWGRGKVTDGACGSIKQTEIIGKSIGQTNYLINEYRNMLQ